MAKKVILKDDNVEIMPITRGELVLDSSGQLAFHSSQFLATQSLPGLMSGEDKTKLDSLEKVTVEDKKVEQVNTTTNDSYRVLFSNSADDTTKTEGTRKSAKLLFNPSTGALTATALIGKLDWSNLNNIPEEFTPAQHIHNTSEITALTSYSKASSASDLVTTDTLNAALGKLEYKADTAYDWIISVTTADTDKYINKWQEILDFLNSVDNSEGADITDEFVTRKTGQTITGEKIFSGTSESLFTIDRNSTSPAWIKFAKNNTLLGYIGIDNSKKVAANIDGTVHYILHSGNYLTFVSKMYWANVLISSTSNAATKPTFSNTIVNGVLTVNGGTKTLTINHNHTLSTAWNDFIACLNPNLTATYHTAHITFGRTYDSKNVGYIGFKYAGSASNSNMVTIGLHSVDNVLNILASGNVGIGTLTPSLKLDVVGSIQSSDTVYGKAITAVGNTVGPYLPNINWFDLTKNVGFHVSYRLNETAKPLRFYYKNSDTFTLLVDITSSGSVGIGTTAPIHKLQVAGAGVFNNTNSTTYASNGITIGAGDAAERYITCYGKTGSSYINVGYGPGTNNSGEFFFNYVSSGSTSNYSGVGIYGGANYMYLYPDYATFRKPLIMPGELYSGNYAINMSNSDIVGINALYTADNAEGGTEGLQFSRGNGYYDSVWASGGVLYFSPNGNLNRTGSYSDNYTVWHTGNLNMGLNTITKTIKPTTSWSDTGIVSSDIGNGVFILYLDPNHSNGNDGWVPTYAGLFVNYTGTNGNLTEEIILQAASHASYKRLFLRFINTANTIGHRKLLIKAESNYTTSYSMKFHFRRII